MTERELQIAFERQLSTIVPSYNLKVKLPSDTIFFYLNKAKDEYVKQVYRVFQQNQELSDKLRTLVQTNTYNSLDFKVQDNKWIVQYPNNYLFSLGEEVQIKILDNKCPNLVTKTRDVIEATIETVDRILENSLSEYHLHHNQARPVRLQTENNIVLYTDGNYAIHKYTLTFLRSAKNIGQNLTKEYTELPEHTHQEIVDAAVNMYIAQAASTQRSEKSDEQ